MIKFWWIFPLLLGFSMLTMSLTFAVEPLFVENIVTILFLLTIVALPVSWVYLLLNRQWWKCIFSFVTSAIIVFVLWLPLVLGALSAPDRFGKNHPIPTGLKYELPLSAECDSLIAADSLHPDTYLQIWNDIQGGMYQYDFYYGHLPAGEIFLRCYEARRISHFLSTILKKAAASTFVPKLNSEKSSTDSRLPFMRATGRIITRLG